MLNKELKLNPDIFEKDVKRETNRKGFADGLIEIAKENDRVVVVSADLAESTFVDEFQKLFPNRFVEVGVAEQNMAGVASGLSAMGKIPFIASYAIFSPGRNWEQIRTTICLNHRYVKIVGSHGGLSVGADGASHQALEDIALTRVLPNMIVLSPCDSEEARKMAIVSAEIDSSVYIRLCRENTPAITTEETPFEIGRAETFYDSTDRVSSPNFVGIIATGPILGRVLRVAEKLVEENIGVKILNLSTIKPLDKDAIYNLAKETGGIVTVEDHQIAGGMGSAVAEFLSANLPVPIEFIGVRDSFGQSGTPDELYKHYRMSEEHIAEAARKAIERKDK